MSFKVKRWHKILFNIWMALTWWLAGIGLLIYMIIKPVIIGWEMGDNWFHKIGTDIYVKNKGNIE